MFTKRKSGTLDYYGVLDPSGNCWGKREDVFYGEENKPVPRDPYWDVVQSLMQNILTIYEAYRDKKPVMLFDMQEHRIYVYPYLEFKNDLSERSQRLLQDQYEQAMTDDKVVVFVRDNDAKKLVSYSV